MTLTDQQIERYSRQIIVTGIGGLGQERLLASSAALVGSPEDAADALSYLAGAGVGRIVLYPVGTPALYLPMAARAAEANPDVRVAVAEEASAADCALLLAIIGDRSAAKVAGRLCRDRHAATTIAARARSSRAAIVARLDVPGRVAILPAPPPCPVCADAGILEDEVGARSAKAGVVAMVAVSEALRLLAGDAGQQPHGAVVEFDGYASRRSEVRRREDAGEPRCACGTAS
jgi:molybdopterin-synthase adenylyltransferase